MTNYNELFVQIPEYYRITLGNKIKVAVLDTGIDPDHEAFNHEEINNLVASTTEFGINDQLNHGTHCAGIIGARQGQLKGLAPQCVFFISKVVSDKGHYNIDAINKALRWAIDNQADVINMSFGMNEDDKDNPVLLSLISEAVNKNIIMVASAGENGSLTKPNELLYPAMLSGIIAVGAVDDSSLAGNFSSKLSFIMPFRKILSCGNNNDYIELEGCSMSAAFVSGMVCLIKAGKTNPSELDLATTLKELNSFSIPVNDQINFDNSLQLIKP